MSRLTTRYAVERHCYINFVRSGDISGGLESISGNEITVRSNQRSLVPVFLLHDTIGVTSAGICVLLHVCRQGTGAYTRKVA